MRIDTNLDIGNYIDVTQRIADGFFDENGAYAPHLGRINAMQVFIESCVLECKWFGEEDLNANEMLSDPEFIEEYTNAIYGVNPSALNFGNAYMDALNIVKNRNGSIVQLAELIGGSIKEFFTPDNIAKLFGASERFNEIIHSDPNKVVSLFGQATE